MGALFVTRKWAKQAVPKEEEGAPTAASKKPTAAEADTASRALEDTASRAKQSQAGSAKTTASRAKQAVPQEEDVAPTTASRTPTAADGDTPDYVDVTLCKHGRMRVVSGTNQFKVALRCDDCGYTESVDTEWWAGEKARREAISKVRASKRHSHRD